MGRCTHEETVRDEHGNEVVMRCTKERVCWSSPTDSRGALPNNVYHTGTCTSIGLHIAQYEYCTTYCVLTPLLTPPLGVSTPAVLTPNLLFPTVKTYLRKAIKRAIVIIQQTVADATNNQAMASPITQLVPPSFQQSKSSYYK